MPQSYPSVLNFQQCLKQAFQAQSGRSLSPYQKDISSLKSRHLKWLLKQNPAVLNSLMKNQDWGLPPGQVFSPSVSDVSLLPAHLPFVSRFACLHFHNGGLRYNKSPPSLKWKQWSEVDKDFPCAEELKKQFSQVPCDFFASLACVFSTCGYVLYVPKNFRPEGGLSIHFTFDSRFCGEGKSPVWNLKNFIFLEEGACLDLVETFHFPASVFVNEYTHIRCGAGSRLKRLRLSEGGGTKKEEEGGLAFHRTLCDLEEKSAFFSFRTDRGAELTSSDMEIRHLGKEAKSELCHLQILKNKEKRKHSYRIHHLKEKGRSRHFSRALLGGASQNFFHSKIHVSGQAGGTDCTQDSKNLLLSSRALAVMRPELKIDHSEVKARHGATTGHLNSEAMFYLKSRGLSQKTAHHLLLWTYIQESLSVFPSEDLRKQLRQYIQKNKMVDACISHKKGF